MGTKKKVGFALLAIMVFNLSSSYADSQHKYFPKTREELKAFVQDESINLGEIDTSAITDMAKLFEGSTRQDFSGIESWDTCKVKYILDTQKFLQENFKSTNHNEHFRAKKPINFTSFSTSVLQKSSSCCDTQMDKNMSCCTKSKNKDSIKNLFFQSLKDYKKLVPYIAIGMGIGAFIHGFVPQDFLQNYLGGFGILNVIFAAFIGILLYVRVEAIIPIGVALLGVGINEGVIMSFLIAGAGCSLPELILLKSIFKLNFLALFVGLVLCIAIGFGMIIYFL